MSDVYNIICPQSTFNCGGESSKNLLNSIKKSALSKAPDKNEIKKISLFHGAASFSTTFSEDFKTIEQTISSENYSPDMEENFNNFKKKVQDKLKKMELQISSKKNKNHFPPTNNKRNRNPSLAPPNEDDDDANASVSFNHKRNNYKIYKKFDNYGYPMPDFADGYTKPFSFRMVATYSETIAYTLGMESCQKKSLYCFLCNRIKSKNKKNIFMCFILFYGRVTMKTKYFNKTKRFFEDNTPDTCLNYMKAHGELFLSAPPFANLGEISLAGFFNAKNKKIKYPAFLKGRNGKIELKKHIIDGYDSEYSDLLASNRSLNIHTDNEYENMDISISEPGDDKKEIFKNKIKKEEKPAEEEENENYNNENDENEQNIENNENNNAKANKNENEDEEKNEEPEPIGENAREDDKKTDKRFEKRGQDDGIADNEKEKEKSEENEEKKRKNYNFIEKRNIKKNEDNEDVEKKQNKEKEQNGDNENTEDNLLEKENTHISQKNNFKNNDINEENGEWGESQTPDNKSNNINVRVFKYNEIYYGGNRDREKSPDSEKELAKKLNNSNNNNNNYDDLSKRINDLFNDNFKNKEYDNSDGGSINDSQYIPTDNNIINTFDNQATFKENTDISTNINNFYKNNNKYGDKHRLASSPGNHTTSTGEISKLSQFKNNENTGATKKINNITDSIQSNGEIAKKNQFSKKKNYIFKYKSIDSKEDNDNKSPKSNRKRNKKFP